MQNSSQWCLRNVQLLRTTVNWCWCCFTLTFCHSSNIHGCTHRFWLSTLWFIDEDASFFHFFSQDNEHTELMVLLFFQNLYAIFAHILRFYHDYIPAKLKMSFIKSNVAIFASVVHASVVHASVVHAYTTIFARRKDKTNYLSNQTWVKCYH